jgi:hypothetical protein
LISESSYREEFVSPGKERVGREEVVKMEV